MYLKLEIEGEESLHSFPDKNRVTIGRAPTSDIQVMADGISRHHLELHEKANGEIYAVDKGSTHGTFINGEQLVKDKPVVFNTFFPAQMGESVFIYLQDEPITAEEEEVEEVKETVSSSLDNFFDEKQTPVAQEEEPPEPPKPSQTFNLDPPKPVKKKPQIHVPKTAGKVTADMQKLMKKNKDAGTKSATRKKKTKKKKHVNKGEVQRKLITAFLIFIVIGFAAYKQYQKIEAERLAAIAAEKEKQEKIAQELELKKKEEEKRLAAIRAEEEKKLFAKKLRDYPRRDKCLSDEELIYCGKFKKTQRKFYEGVIKELETLYIISEPASVRAMFDEYKYAPDEYDQLFLAAKQTVGLAFHSGRFTKLQNFKLDRPSRSNENYAAFALGDILYSYREGFPKLDEIKKVVAISVLGGEYVAHVVLDYEKLIAADFAQDQKAVLYAFRSNILSPLKLLFKKYELKEK